MIYYFISMIENEDDRTLAERLYFEHRQEVYKIAMSFFKDTDRAEDGVCDVFERVCKNIKQFTQVDCNKHGALIVVYSKNLFRNQWRRDKIITFEELDDKMIAHGDTTENIVIENSSYSEILEAIRSLDEKYSEVCTLKYFIGLQDVEIAEALGITPENVRVRLHRSRAMVRKQLAKEGLEV